MTPTLSTSIYVESICGVFHGLPAQKYHALPGASSSRLKAFLGVSPAHARIAIQEPREDTVYSILGSLGHYGILEPDKPLPRIAIEPDEYPEGAVFPGNTPIGAKAKMKDWTYRAYWCCDWRERQKDCGFITLSQAEGDQVHGMVNAVKSHPIAAPLLAEGQSEVSLVTYDETNKVHVRCRLDWVPPGPSLVDIKTTFDVREREIVKHAYAQGWHLQAALYLDVWNAMCGVEATKDEFRFVCVEQRAPHAVNVFKCSPEFIAAGRAAYRQLLPIYAECVRSGVWPSYAPELIELGLPKWVGREE